MLLIEQKSLFSERNVDMDKEIIKAYAKINLHLDVIGKAENGYHEVNTVMQTVSLCDEIEISLNRNGSHSIVCNSPAVPTDRRNLAWRAADLFFESVGESCFADIKITKNIPVAAGLAGGSTDSAAVFVGLNRLCGYPLTVDELLALGAKLGADVPFCMVGGTKFADHYGEVLHEFPSMPECFIVVACGNEGVSTPWAYSTLDGKYGDFAQGKYTPRDIAPLEAALREGNVEAMCKFLYNIFEVAIEPHRPQVSRIKELMRSHGAVGAMMSGSGPSVFGVFADEKAAVEATELLCAEGVDAFLATPVFE